MTRLFEVLFQTCWFVQGIGKLNKAKSVICNNSRHSFRIWEIELEIHLFVWSVMGNQHLMLFMDGMLFIVE